MNTQVNKLATMSVADPFNLASMDVAANYNSAIAEMIHSRAAEASNILDFGAGRGVFANMFAGKITCVEPDLRVGSHIDRKHNVASSLVALDNNQFDFVYSINVLEHIEDDTASLAGLSGVMREGGRLFLLLPARDELFTEMDTYVGHYRRYNVKDIRSKLYETGFRIDGFRYFDIAGYFSTLACKYAGKLIGWKGSLTPCSVAAYDRFVFPISCKLDALTNGTLLGKNILVDAVKL
jgi:SAM-dependent methyltransferase